jgi:hypothetical protein
MSATANQYLLNVTQTISTANTLYSGSATTLNAALALFATNGVYVKDMIMFRGSPLFDLVGGGAQNGSQYFFFNVSSLISGANTAFSGSATTMQQALTLMYTNGLVFSRVFQYLTAAQAAPEVSQVDVSLAFLFSTAPISQENVLAHASVTLTATQIKALNVTPVVLVPAPGAGSSVVLAGPIMLRYTEATADFSGGGNITLQYTTGPVTASGALADTALQGASTENIILPIAAAPTINDSIQISSAGAFTGSTAAGTLKVDFDYRIV